MVLRSSPLGLPFTLFLVALPRVGYDTVISVIRSESRPDRSGLRSEPRDDRLQFTEEECVTDSVFELKDNGIVARARDQPPDLARLDNTVNWVIGA